MESRRKFLKKAVYAAPLIMTVAVRPAFARNGYGGGGGGGGGSVGGGGGNNISNPSGPTNPGPTHAGGGNKDSHDWWMFWEKL